MSDTVTNTGPPPKSKRFELVEDFHWVINHSWSLRFAFLAFLLSGAEIALPLITSLQGVPYFPIILGLITGAAFVARLVAQNKAGVDG
jgi:hypothetical protein